MKAVILIIIGLTHGQPNAQQAGVFQNADECQKAWTLFAATAMLNKVPLSGVCIVYNIPGKDV